MILVVVSQGTAFLTMIEMSALFAAKRKVVFQKVTGIDGVKANGLFDPLGGGGWLYIGH